MNRITSTIVDEASAERLLKSLGFLEVTEICILSGEGTVLRRVGFMAQKFRGCWGVDGSDVAVISPEGKVYLHYGYNNSVINGQVFKDIIKEFGCQRLGGRTVIEACTPRPGEFIDYAHLAKIACGQIVLT